MKRSKNLLAAILCLTLSFGIFSCSGNGNGDGTSATEQPTVTPDVTTQGEPTSAETTTAKENEAPAPEKVDLNGKKILIIGNSYVYYGKSVISKGTSVTDQASRSNDKGFFYQLCRENGYEVSVTNWTFGGHGLYDFCANPCSQSGCNGIMHQKFLTDPVFDYVLISPGGGDKSEKNIAETFGELIDFFTAANPNVRIVCLGNLGAHGYSSFGTVEPGIYTYYKELEKKGVIIADWGGLVNGIIDGEYKVEGAKQPYSKKTFIVKDGFHPNPLAGYITTLMAYCAITGDSPIGQEYKFCFDKTVNAKFDMEDFISDYYVNGNTNFLDVFKSESDMAGIQKLVDEYLKAKPYQSAEIPTVTTKMLTTRPTDKLISVVFRDSAQTGDGWMTYKSDPSKTFSGIRGDKDMVTSPLINSATLTEAQKLDIADIGYGVSVIGISHIDDTKSGAFGTVTAAGTSNAVWNLVNGHWGSSLTTGMYFDAEGYDVNGKLGGKYTALITLNFGEIRKFSAMGYTSGNLKGFPQAHDVYVSDDGINWTKVESACYNAKDFAPAGLDTDPNPDPWNNNVKGLEVLFDMGGVSGKYIRIGVIRGGDMDNDLGLEQINTREIMVYGE